MRNGERVTLTLPRHVFENAVAALAKMANDESESQHNRDLAFRCGCTLNQALLALPRVPDGLSGRIAEKRASAGGTDG